MDSYEIGKLFDVSKVNQVPRREFHFERSEETEEMMVLVDEMKAGEVLRFAVDKTQPKEEQYDEAHRIETRLDTVFRNLPGEFRRKRRKFDVYVECLSRPEGYGE